jgi:hypothetical protein
MIKSIIFHCGVTIGLIGLTFAVPKTKPMKGSYYVQAGLFDAEKGKLCRADSSAGDLIYVSNPHENPLFPSKSPNMVHLFLWFQNGIQANHRYQMPDSTVKVCYYEKGDLLMFHTFEATGSIQFKAGKRADEWQGAMELKLVHPFHNMSNSDYHYMGGPFTLTRKALP